MRVLDAAGWLALAFGAAAAVLVVLPLQPGFILPSLDDSFAATLHYAVAHRGAPGTALISSYGPLGFVHYPLYYPDTFTALVWWRLLIAVVLVVPLAWLGWAPSASPWGAALAVFASAPFLAVDDLRGVLLPIVAVLIELVPRQRPPAVVSLLLGAGLGVMALMKGTFLILGLVALMPSVLALRRAPPQPPWTAIGALATAAVIWSAIGLGFGDAVAFLDWSLREIVPGYASAMQVPTQVRFVVQAIIACAALLLAAIAVARRDAPPRWLTVAVFALALFLAFKVGFVRAEVHMYITIDLLIVTAVLLGLLWGERRPVRVAVAVVALAALPVALFAQVLAAGIMPVGPYRVAAPSEIRNRAEHLPDLVDRSEWTTTHERYAMIISVGQPLPPLDGPVDIYPFQQGIVLAHGLTLRARPVFQSYMAYTSRLARANAEWLASDQAAPRILFRPVSLDNRLAAQDDAASWPQLLSRYDPVPPAGVLALLERRQAPRPWRLAPLQREQTTTGVPIAVPAAPRLWARFDVHVAPEDALVGVLLAPPTLWLTMTFADGHTLRSRLVPALARDGFLLSPFVNSAADFVALYDAAATPPDRVITQVRLDLASPFGGSWGERPVAVELSALEIEPGA